jgi:formyl-CoA transferase
LVYCSVSGYGRTGPYAQQPGYDFIVQAEGGLMGITGPEEGIPYRLGVPIIDISSGMFAATAILAALRTRDVTGEGQLVDISLLDSCVALLTNVASNYLIGGVELRRLGNAHPNIAPYEAFRARDRWFALAAANQRQWVKLCELLSRSDLKDDTRFNTNGARVTNRSALVATLNKTFATRNADEWLANLRKAGLPCGPINIMSDVFNHPQVQARGLALETEHPTVGPLRIAGFPYKLSRTPAGVHRPPPLLGEHTQEVLTELLNYTDYDIVSLRQRGAI